MEIYRLSKLGYALSHSTTNPRTAEWGVIHYLGRMHTASKEKILAEVPGASVVTLSKLRMKKILLEETGMGV